MQKNPGVHLLNSVSTQQLDIFTNFPHYVSRNTEDSLNFDPSLKIWMRMDMSIALIIEQDTVVQLCQIIKRENSQQCSGRADGADGTTERK